MKKLFVLMVIVSFLLMGGIAGAVDKTVDLTWVQDCVDGCPGTFGAVEEWHVFISDVSGTYGATPIIVMPYDGTALPTYASSYVLSLTGAGTKYFIVRSYNSTSTPQESGDSNEVGYTYNFMGTAVPVNLTFTISTP